MGNPFFQPADPAAAPDPVTPRGGPSDPAGYAGVAPRGAGPAPAPYDIAAPQDIAGITAAVEAAGRLSGAGILYPQGPRQAEALAILDSPQGAASSDVFAGFPDYEDADLRPGPNMENPVQGTGTLPGSTPYPGTIQGGVPQFTAGLGASAGGGLPGVPPESGSMTPSAGGDYPGTLQDGLQKYGTS